MPVLRTDEDRKPAKQKMAVKWGLFPAAAAAPTDPSFRDSYLNGQCIEFSRIFFWKSTHPSTSFDQAVR